MQNRVPQLDGVRGIAILLVMLVNTSEKFPQLHLQPIVGNGWMGVDLFFVLSGFLITGILLDSRDAPRYFQNFYARRALRILPLYYAVLLFMFVAVPLLRPTEGQMVFAKSSPWWAYPFFLQNFLIGVPTMATGPLGTTWSLAIEEQFYLLWPLVVRFCPLATLRRIAAAMILGAPLLTFYLWKHGVLIYSSVFCRQVALMAGALLALRLHSAPVSAFKYVKAAWVVFPVALALAFGCEYLNARWLTFTLVALAAASFVFLSLYAQQAWLQAVLRNRFLRYTGKISYGLYLLHKIPSDFTQVIHLDRRPYLLLPFIFLGSYAMAALSWKLLEQPFLKLKRFFPSGPEGSQGKESPVPDARSAANINEGAGAV